MFWSIPNLMALERGILSSVSSKARNIDTCQLKHKSKNSSGRSYIALLSQVHTIHRSQHSIWASLVGTHQYAQFVGLDSRCTFAPAVLAYLWKAELDSIAYLFTCIFYLNIWRKLKNVIDWFPYSLQAAFPFERLGMGAFRIALESVFNR